MRTRTKTSLRKRSNNRAVETHCPQFNTDMKGYVIQRYDKNKQTGICTDYIAYRAVWKKKCDALLTIYNDLNKLNKKIETIEEFDTMTGKVKDVWGYKYETDDMVVQYCIHEWTIY